MSEPKRPQNYGVFAVITGVLHANIDGTKFQPVEYYTKEEMMEIRREAFRAGYKPEFEILCCEKVHSDDMPEMLQQMEHEFRVYLRTLDK